MSKLNSLFFRRESKSSPNEDLSGLIDAENVPRHIAVIMDGNGRWAVSRGLPRTFGHRAGMTALKELVTTCGELGIEILTVYAFSTENWKRPVDEVGFLMDLIEEYLDRELDELHQKQVRICTLGEITELPSKAQNALKRAERITEHNSGLHLNIALNYGGRREILRAVALIAQKTLEGEINIEQIDEDLFRDQLYTRGLPDPDLVIRPSGEQRLSNFLLWQCAYSEFWTSEVLWPDFRKQDLYAAIIAYQQRNRRYGGL